MDELPSKPWTLPAPESLVLLWGPETSEVAALKHAILDLIAREALVLSTVEERRLLVLKRPVNVLSPGRFAHSVTEPALAVLSLAGTRPKTYANGVSGVPVKQAASVALSRYRRKTRIKIGPLRVREPSGGYVRDVVLPALESRGLFQRVSQSAVLGGPTITWELSPAGERELDVLRRLTMFERDHFARWVATDPEPARLFVERAGPAVLLMPDVMAKLPQLAGLRSASTSGWGEGRGPTDVGRTGFAIAALLTAFAPLGFAAVNEAVAHGVDDAWEALTSTGGGE